LRRGLQDLVIPGRAYYMDCSDAFSDRLYTTFADIWHFADPGHVLLSRTLRQKLEPILANVQARRTIPAPLIARS